MHPFACQKSLEEFHAFLFHETKKPLQTDGDINGSFLLKNSI